MYVLFCSHLPALVLIIVSPWRRVQTGILVVFSRSAPAAVVFLPGQSGPGAGAAEDQALGRECSSVRPKSGLQAQESE